MEDFFINMVLLYIGDCIMVHKIGKDTYKTKKDILAWISFYEQDLKQIEVLLGRNYKFMENLQIRSRVRTQNQIDSLNNQKKIVEDKLLLLINYINGIECKKQKTPLELKI